MIQELIYTSVPRGLKPGTRGFCTVACTQGMPPNLIEKLESLSGYRHLYDTAGARTAVNQIVSQHVQLTVNGRRLQVLTHIQDAGIDYSQRSNKFAHHVLCDAQDVSPCGPAWLLSQPGFMRRDWTGEPQTLPPTKAFPPGKSSPAICRHWAALTGDAGWGGVLAATIAGDKRAAAIIIPKGFNPLPLVAESIALLPESLRWQVTFSTYFTRLPPGVECQWRFYVEGTQEAATAARGPQGLCINLCQPLPQAEGGPLVESARTGVLAPIAAPQATPRPAPPPGSPIPPPGSSAPDIDELDLLLAADQPPTTNAGPRRHPAIAMDEGYRVAPPPPPSMPPAALVNQLPRQSRRKGNTVRRILLGLAAAILLIAYGSGAFWLGRVTAPQQEVASVTMTHTGQASKSLAQEKAPLAAAPVQPVVPATSDKNDAVPPSDGKSVAPVSTKPATAIAPKVVPGPKDAPQPAPENAQKNAGTTPTAAPNQGDAPPENPKNTNPVAASEPQQEPPPADVPPAAPKPVDRLAALRGRVLNLPKLEAKSNLDGRQDDPQLILIGVIPDGVPDDLQFEFLGLDQFDPAMKLAIQPPTAGEHEKVWEVRMTSSRDRDRKIAEFVAQGTSFSFRWKDTFGLTDRLNQLANCVLKLRENRKEAEPVTLPLREAVLSPKAINFFTSKAEEESKKIKFERSFEMNGSLPKNCRVGFDLIPSPGEGMIEREALKRIGEGQWRMTRQTHGPPPHVSVSLDLTAKAGSQDDKSAVSIEIELVEVKADDWAWKAGKTPIPSFFNLTKRKSARDSEIKKHDTEIASLNAELANNQQEVRKQRKQKIERFKSDAVKERDVIDSILTLYKELADPNKAKIEFRVYMTVEGTEVDLLRSKDFPKPVAKAIESSKS